MSWSFAVSCPSLLEVFTGSPQWISVPSMKSSSPVWIPKPVTSNMFFFFYFELYSLRAFRTAKAALIASFESSNIHNTSSNSTPLCFLITGRIRSRFLNFKTNPYSAPYTLSTSSSSHSNIIIVWLPKWLLLIALSNCSIFVSGSCLDAKAKRFGWRSTA